MSNWDHIDDLKTERGPRRTTNNRDVVKKVETKQAHSQALQTFLIFTPSE